MLINIGRWCIIMSIIDKGGSIIEKQLLCVTHKGRLHIGETTIPCAVLEDGTRVLSETSITNAILKTRSGAARRKKLSEKEGPQLPVFLASESLKPFISSDLMDGAHVIHYLDGKREIKGYNALVLPAVCDVWLKARENGVLKQSQLEKAHSAEILMRSLAKVGIIALIDEATGYQADREKEALQKLLSLFVSQELLPWIKTFPDEFYKEMFRLKGWDYKGRLKTPYVGKLTNYLVYDRLPEEVVKELKRLNPYVENKNYRKYRHFQHLTTEHGYIQLRTQISTSMTMMRGFDNWSEFDAVFRRSYGITEPIVDTNEQLEINLDELLDQ